MSPGRFSAMPSAIVVRARRSRPGARRRATAGTRRPPPPARRRPRPRDARPSPRSRSRRRARRRRRRRPPSRGRAPARAVRARRVPWPATTSGSSNGWMNAIAALGGALARLRDAGVDRARRPRRPAHRALRQPSTFPSGAPGGITTSHGTPRWRAASATAQAWLPALPATTPRSAAAPSAASFAVAPRTLNEPVRCRLSAFSTTSPAGSARRASRSRAPACGARRARRAGATRAMSLRGDRAVGGIRSVRQRDDRVDLDVPRPSGSAATPIVVRAGGSAGKNSP